MTFAFDQRAPRNALRDKIEACLRGKAKPIGALGQLETVAIQIGMVTGGLKPDLGPASVIVFAGDHGLTAEGISAYPSSVTVEIAKLILAAGAGISVCARAAGAGVMLVDAGLSSPLEPHPNLISCRIAAGTGNALKIPAMTAQQCDQAFAAGRDIVHGVAGTGSKLLAFGEVGIGNTSAAALLAHAVSGIPLDTLVGLGAGAPPGGIDHKRRVLAAVWARAAINGIDSRARAIDALLQFAGFEMAMMAGAFQAAAEDDCIVVVDGFIASAVAAAAIAIDPHIKDHCIFAHCSAEAGHRALLKYLDVQPLLDLGLRLGEGTGAALALPIVRAAEGLLRDMADLPGEHPS